MYEQLIVKTPQGGAAGAPVVGTPNGLIDANAEVLTCNVEDMSNITVHVLQVTDASTVSMLLEATIDGVSWLAIGAAITEASFPAGANQVVERSLSDANGMSLCYRAIRLRATALGGGTYSVAIAGRQRHMR